MLKIREKVGSVLICCWKFELILIGKSSSRHEIERLYGGKSKKYRNLSFITQPPSLCRNPPMMNAEKINDPNLPGAEFDQFAIFDILTCAHDYSWKKLRGVFSIFTFF